jgi:hypothetical protein
MDLLDWPSYAAVLDALNISFLDQFERNSGRAEDT